MAGGAINYGIEIWTKSIETCSHPWGTEVWIGHIDNSAEPSTLHAGVVTDTGSVDEGSRGSLLILKLL